MALDCPHCNKAINDAIPRERFDKIYKERKDATAKVGELEEALATATAAGAELDTWRTQVEELGKRLENAESGHVRSLEIARAGITDADDAADLLALFDRRAPEGVTFGEWIGDREALPRAAAALFPSTSAPAAVEPATNGAIPATPPPPATTPATALPPANRGAQSYNGAPSAFSADQIAGMTTAEYRAHRDAILGSLTG